MIMLRKLSEKKERQNAQGMVEFALILPILLLVILGIIEFGRLLFFYSSVTSASREAARYGSAVGEVNGVDRYRDCAGIRDAARRVGAFAGIVDGDITIQYDDGTNLIDAACPPGVTIDLADRIVITVSKNFTPLVPLVNIPPLPITSTTARTIIKEVGVRGTPVPTDPLPGVNTPTPTETPEFTNTPTDTPTATATDTATATATETGTPLPTATAPVIPPTATYTSIPPTPTNTPTPPCPSPIGLSIGSGSDSKKVTFEITNPSVGFSYTIERISIDWPNGELNKITFSSLSLTPNDQPPDFSVDPGWTGTFANPEAMIFIFQNPVSSPVNVQVKFQNCEVISGSE
jgi:hypothetical protein